MAKNPEQQERLSRFIELAQDYKGWSRNQLARALGRDATKIVPESGNPKLDLVTRLADVLEWSVGDVAELLVGKTDELLGSGKEGAEFLEVLHEGQQARADGRPKDAIRLARNAASIATTPEESARCFNLEAISWDALGRFTRSLEAIRKGLALPSISRSRRMLLLSNLAHANYTLWRLDEARSLASEIIEWYRSSDVTDLRNRSSEAFAFFVRGNALRRCAPIYAPEDKQTWELASQDLSAAKARYDALADETDYASVGPLAFISETAILECRAAVGKIEPAAVIKQIIASLEQVLDVHRVESSDWLEAHGWACIIGCNISLRHHSPLEQQRDMAILTNKAYEIADFLDHWALRERTFTLENARRQAVEEPNGASPWVLDRQDVRVIAGTMGRFPGFVRTGWDILDTAKIIRGN